MKRAHHRLFDMDLVERLKRTTRDDFQTEAERDEAINAAKAFLSRMESPFARLWGIAIDMPALTAALKVCLDIDLSPKWRIAGGGDK